MQKRRPFRHASCSAGVLQKRDVVRTLLNRLESLPVTFGDGGVKFDVTRQIPRGHHLLHASHDEIDQRALDAHQVAHRRDDDMFDRRIADNRLQRDGEVFEQDDRLPRRCP